MPDTTNWGRAMDTAIDVVTERMNSLDATAQQYSGQLMGALNTLGNLRMADVKQAQVMPTPHTPAPVINVGGAPTYAPTALKIPSLPGSPAIDALLNDLGVGDMDALPNAPSMPALMLPSAPGMADVPVPARPDVDTRVEIPNAPTVNTDWSALDAITVPDFAFPQLPDFDGQPPSANISVPNVFINWAEPQYESELLDELTAQVRSMMAGGTGLPPAVEDALFSRARERDSAETSRAVQEAVDTWAARGFTMPPGMLAKQAGVVREQGRLKAAELNRDIMAQAAQWQIENIRFAVQQGMALEQLTSNIFDNAVKRLFEVARFQAEAQINVFNAQISLFNAQNSAYQTLAQVFATRLEAFKTALQSKQVAVDVVKAKIEAVQASVEIYKAMMQGASVRADVIKNQFDAYRADVQAYAERVGAEKVKFEAYAEQVKGETAKAGLFESQARAYAATVGAIASKADIKAKGASLKLDAARVKISQYSAGLDAFKAQLQASLSEVQQGTEAFRAQVAGWQARSQASISETEMQSRFADMNARTNIAYSQMQISEYQANIEKVKAMSGVVLEAAKAVGQYTAQLAAGAMSAMHVQAQIAGYGNQNSSYQYSEQHTYKEGA